MRYWVRDAKEIRGPFTPEELDAQGLSDSALVCREGRSRRKAINWLPLRLAKSPRYFTRLCGRVRGPYSAAELARLEGFGPDSLVCPETSDRRSRWNWAPAGSFAELGLTPKPARAAPARPARAGRGWCAAWQAWRRRRVPVLPVAATTAAVIFGLMVWLRVAFLPSVRQTYLRIATGSALSALAELQGRHLQKTGAFADDLGSLLPLAQEPKLPVRLAQSLDLQTLLVRGTSEHFLLEANALDERRTLIRFEGSARRRAP